MKRPGKTIPTTFSVERSIVEAFRTAAKGGPESASQVVSRLMAGWTASKTRHLRNGDAQKNESRTAANGRGSEGESFDDPPRLR